MYIKPFNFLTYIFYVFLHLPDYCIKKFVYAEQLNNSLIAKCVRFLSSQFSCDAVFIAKCTHFRRIPSYPLDTIGDLSSGVHTSPHMQPPTETWEGLIPTSFQATLYLPSLKIAVTAGSFILYHKGDTSTAPQVG
jgi:hypothetical protein